MFGAPAVLRRAELVFSVVSTMCGRGCCSQDLPVHDRIVALTLAKDGLDSVAPVRIRHHAASRPHRSHTRTDIPRANTKQQCNAAVTMVIYSVPHTACHEWCLSGKCVRSMTTMHLCTF